MKIKLKIEKEYDVKFLNVNAQVRYWEDSRINGVFDKDEEEFAEMPCKLKGGVWNPVIDIETGIIVNWKDGVEASIHYKVCDGCAWSMIDVNNNLVLGVVDGYVPETLCPQEEGYGDYIIMDIDENGKIANWEFNIDDFIKQ